ncbi:hypothetical protein ACSS6W_003421 [Trichoderma asperelloides]|nr:hypothetical protein LI328DRAFT_122751 [Trichoderma asperelloides]
MATATPSRNRYQNVYPGTPSTEKRRLNGLWHRNEWWCNCDPRKRAVERAVTRDTPNRGKHFWACPHPPPDGCGFFLFAQEARVREIGLTPSSSNEAVAVPPAATPSKAPTLTQTRLTDIGVEILGGRRRSNPEYARLTEDDGDAETASHPQPVSSSQPEAGSSPDKGKGKAVAETSSTYEPLTPGPSGGRKRGCDEFEEDLLSDMDSEEERELATMTDRSAQRFLREEAYSGSSQQADDDEGNAAASSSRPVARTLFPQAQGVKRRKSVSFEEPEPSAPTSSKATTSHSDDTGCAPLPSTMQISPPSSMEEAPPFPSSAMTATQQNDDEEEKEGGDNEIAEQVMSLLQTQPIDRSVLESVHNLLLVSARRTRGIAMGRDSARAAVNEKKMKIGRLQEKIAALESTERSLNSQITHMKAGLMKMYEAN